MPDKSLHNENVRLSWFFDNTAASTFFKFMHQTFLWRCKYRYTNDNQYFHDAHTTRFYHESLYKVGLNCNLKKLGSDWLYPTQLFYSTFYAQNISSLSHSFYSFYVMACSTSWFEFANGFRLNIDYKGLLFGWFEMWSNQSNALSS